MWVWFFKALCFVCVRFSSSLFITAAFFFALLLRTGYAIFRKYALQMNHQMIVVKLQPLWMLLLRGSTRVCSGAHRVWVGDLWCGLSRLRRCLSCSSCHGQHGRDARSRGEHRSPACSHTSAQRELQQHQNTRRERTLPSGRSPVKLPSGSSGALQGCEKQGHN